MAARRARGEDGLAQEGVIALSIRRAGEELDHGAGHPGGGEGGAVRYGTVCICSVNIGVAERLRGKGLTCFRSLVIWQYKKGISVRAVLVLRKKWIRLMDENGIIVPADYFQVLGTIFEHASSRSMP